MAAHHVDVAVGGLQPQHRNVVGVGEGGNRAAEPVTDLLQARRGRNRETVVSQELHVSIPEALDAMRCASQPGVLADREVLRTALRVALVKDQRDEPVFDEIFDAFFSLVRVGGAGRGHGHSTVTRISPTRAN